MGLPCLGLRKPETTTQTMKTMTPRELAEHLRLLKASTERELDELLTDLLVHSYPTKAVQNS